MADKKPTTKTMTVLDTHDEIKKALVDAGVAAPPQGKAVRLPGKGQKPNETNQSDTQENQV